MSHLSGQSYNQSIMFFLKQEEKANMLKEGEK